MHRQSSTNTHTCNSPRLYSEGSVVKRIGQIPSPGIGGFLIRLANFAHLDNQSDSEKKAKRHSKALGEKRSNPGSFWFTAVGGSFFQRHKNFRVASLASEWHKRCTSSTCCMFLLSYSIAVNIRRLQCNMSKQTSSKQHVLALGLCG